MPTHEIKRTGQRPLQFEGELLAEIGGKWNNGKELNRWHDLAVYRTTGGAYVIAIALRTLWQGEHDQFFAGHSDTAQAIEEVIRDHNPCPDGIGYPPGETYADRQQRVENDLRRNYDARVTELFEALGSTFAEILA